MATEPYIMASAAGVVLLRSSARYVSLSAPQSHERSDAEKLDIDVSFGGGSG